MAAALTTYLFICSVHSSQPSSDLFDLENPTVVAFYDYGKTSTVIGFGSAILNICEEDTPANPCDQIDDMVNTLHNLPNTEQAVIEAFGGQARIDRYISHLERVTSGDSSIKNIFILSTSWDPVPKEEWANFIFETFTIVGLDEFFPRTNILTLTDPGADIPADKGAVLQAKLDELGITDPATCIFSDDSDGNIESATGKCDTLDIARREGLDVMDFNYIESRAKLPCDEDNEVSDSRSSDSK